MPAKSQKRQIVIIGSGAAGLAAASEVVRLDQSTNVTLLSNEGVAPYSKPLISHVLAGECAASQAFLEVHDLVQHPRVEFQFDADVQYLESQRRFLVLRQHAPIEYDRLLIATGSAPTTPRVQGLLDLPGIVPFMTLEHLSRVQRYLPGCRQVVVLGAGLIGLRAAYALCERGLEVSVVEILPRVLGSVLDGRGSQKIVELLESRGIRMLLNSKLVRVEGDRRNGIAAAILESGERLPCQMLLQCAGVQPALDWAKGTDLVLGRGVLVDEFLQTSLPDVFAAGDCAEPLNFVTNRREIIATWTQARLQGKIAGRNLCGAQEVCPVGVAENSIGFFGVPCVTFGVAEPPTEAGFEVLTHERPADGAYRKIVLQEGRIVGAVFFKDLEGSGLIDRLIRDRIDVSGIKDGILTFRRDYIGFLKKLLRAEMLGDVVWPERIGMTIEYHKRFDDRKWEQRVQGEHPQ